MKRKSYGSIKEIKLLFYTTILIILFMIIIPIMSIGIKFNLKNNKDIRVNENIEKQSNETTEDKDKENINEGAKKEDIIDEKTEETEAVASNNVVKEIYVNGTDGAIVLGAHLEGPFISPSAIGAQNPNYLIAPSYENFKSMTGDAMDTVVSITMAPEVEGAKELASVLSSKGIRCSIGHTKATYEEAIDGIKCGFCHSTHLFNAMTGFTHREPGVVGATFDTDITTETISDGIHISYPSLRVVYKQKGTDKTLLVTDAMCACGMPDGTYSLGGQPVTVKSGAARLNNGALAGSILTLNKSIKNIHDNTNYPLYEIVKMASYNGAKYCRVDDKKGQIKENFDADLTIFDENIDVKMTIIGGKIVYNNL